MAQESKPFLIESPKLNLDLLAFLFYVCFVLFCFVFRFVFVLFVCFALRLSLIGVKGLSPANHMSRPQSCLFNNNN